MTIGSLPSFVQRSITGLALVCALSPSPAFASLVLDPTVAPPETSGAVSVSAGLANGFLPVVFGPAAKQSTPIISWLPEGFTNHQAKALHWHIQNAMPWPVTITVMIADNNGRHLNTSVALPPGPPQTMVIPLHPVSPNSWGMRAPPPQPFLVGSEPVLVATNTVGKLAGPPHRISISMPSPDVDQTILLGKLFVPAGRDDSKALYTDLLDCFGQFTRLDWPGKKTAGCEPDSKLRPAPASTEPSVQSAGQTDRYGGLLLPGWPASTLASGAFRVHRMPDLKGKEGDRWILLTPLGNPFFSLGVNAIQLNNSATFIAGRQFMFAALPDEQSPLAAFYGARDSTEVLPAEAGAQQGRRFRSGRTFDFYRANLYRQDGEQFPERWQDRTEARLRQWRFNTAAAWSDETFTQQSELAYTAIIHVSGPFQRLSDGHNWWQGIPDPFDPAFRLSLEQTFAKVVPAHKNNDRLIGYFVDNELAWGDGSSDNPHSRYGPVLSALAMDARQPGAFAKRAFIQALKTQYGEIAHLARAWQQSFDSWAQLDAPLLTDQTSLHARLISHPEMASDLSTLLSFHAQEYFRLVSEALRSADPSHLYLGSHFASRTPEAVAACVQYCDVVSFNLYVPDIATGFEASAFARHNKPAMLTEFHFGSADRGPFWPGVMSVASEQARGPAYQVMIDSVLSNRQFVGAHWFQYLDQPATGRWLDGENGHLGLVSITDAPWHEFVESVSATNAAAVTEIANQISELMR